MKNKELIGMYSIDFKGCKNNTEKRLQLKSALEYYFTCARLSAEKNTEVFVLIERARTFSGGHLSTAYLLSIGSLIATILDVAYQQDIEVYSVDTKAWKRQIVGTTESKKNKYEVNPNKYPTILYLKEKGLLERIAIPYTGKGKKGVIPIKINGVKTPCRINDDLADSYCIAEYAFLPEAKQKLKKESI